MWSDKNVHYQKESRNLLGENMSQWFRKCKIFVHNVYLSSTACIWHLTSKQNELEQSWHAKLHALSLSSLIVSKRSMRLTCLDGYKTAGGPCNSIPLRGFADFPLSFHEPHAVFIQPVQMLPIVPTVVSQEYDFLSWQGFLFFCKTLTFQKIIYARYSQKPCSLCINLKSHLNLKKIPSWAKGKSNFQHSHMLNAVLSQFSGELDPKDRWNTRTIKAT